MIKQGFIPSKNRPVNAEVVVKMKEMVDYAYQSYMYTWNSSWYTNKPKYLQE